MASRIEIIDAFGYFARVRLQNGPDAEEMEATVEAWELTFDDVSGQELHAAAVAWVRLPEKGRWWPTPADVRELIPRLKQGTLALEAADPVKGRDRWPEIVRQAGSIGRSHPDWPEELASRIGVKDSERLKRAIEDAGGWRNLCYAQSDYDRQAMGRRFAASWDRQARAVAAGLLQGSPQRALESNGSGDPEAGGVVDLQAEIARRKALGAPRG